MLNRRTLLLCFGIGVIGMAGVSGKSAYAGEGEASPHIVMMIAEREFNTRQTLPDFAAEHLEPEGMRITVVEPREDGGGDFPGLIEALGDADLLVLSVRRRALPEDQMQALRDYLEGGNPLVAIRTASHAFGPREIPEGRTEWPEFDVEVLGGDYQMHYGNRGDDEPATIVEPAEDAAGHPILEGVEGLPFGSDWHLYRNRDLAEGATLLLSGHVEGQREQTTEAVAWTHVYEGGRVFYTSLGGPEDFALEPFQEILRNAVFWALER